jgi:hypothetical protein
MDVVNDDASGNTPLLTAKVEAYYQSLSEREQAGFRVATKLLGSTFDVVKTRGFLAWQQQQQQQQQQPESSKKRKVQ